MDKQLKVVFKIVIAAAITTKEETTYAIIGSSLLPLNQRLPPLFQLNDRKTDQGNSKSDAI